MKTAVKTIILVIILAVIGYLGRSKFANVPQENLFKVHLVIPIEHQALQDISEGFQESLSHLLPHKVSYTFHNAQGDLNLQRSILQKLAQEKCDLIVPIGTQTTQLTLKLIKDKPVVSLAAMYTEDDRKDHLLTGVLDEIPAIKFVSFLRALHPHEAKTVIIHSTDDRRVQDAIEMEKLLHSQNIQTKRLLIHTLNDLYTISQSLPNETHSVVVLKDHLVVSGISILKKVCDEKNIMLITSDEGTVKGGASLGFGVTEKDIGIKGGKIAATILKGKDIHSIPIQHLKELKVFVNEGAIKNNPNLKTLLTNICQQHHYQLVSIKPEGSPK